MRRPAKQEKVLERLAKWRSICPELAVRSTFIVGFPGESEEDFEFLLAWLKEAQLERVGCFKYEPVAGAKSNDLGGHVAEEIKEERWHRFMQSQQRISRGILKRKIGRETEVIIDGLDQLAGKAIARSPWDAPQIDGNVFVKLAPGMSAGDIRRVRITGAEDYDLRAQLL
jgi:ribosomal protein S12 methylthiotransferase